jgi:FAD/FMN-containing dehydrogenase
MSDQATDTFARSLRGRLIRPTDPDYEEARALYNGMIDKRPRLIARCVNVTDVIAAVTFAREEGLLLAIRGGGHNGPGLGSVNDGLVIDLSLMKSVRVDPRRRPSALIPAARPATSIMRPTRSAWPFPSASYRPPALPA